MIQIYIKESPHKRDFVIAKIIKVNVKNKKVPWPDLLRWSITVFLLKFFVIYILAINFPNETSFPILSFSIHPLKMENSLLTIPKMLSPNTESNGPNCKEGVHQNVYILNITSFPDPCLVSHGFPLSLVLGKHHCLVRKCSS